MANPKFSSSTLNPYAKPFFKQQPSSASVFNYYHYSPSFTYTFSFNSQPTPPPPHTTSPPHFSSSTALPRSVDVRRPEKRNGFVSRGPRCMGHRRPRRSSAYYQPRQDGGAVVPKVVNEQNGGKTSLMIRNIPNLYQRDYMLELIDEHCRSENTKADLNSDSVRSEYDFFYLPFDFVRSRSNLGYAFVNFTNPIGAYRFRKAFQGFEWDNKFKKICEISWATLQGKVEFTKHFINVRFPCTTDKYLPVVFARPRNGWGVLRFKVLGKLVGPSPWDVNGSMLKCQRRQSTK
ncbi:hypothetical protein ACFE04_025829 [Oxalis oulophora]